MAKFRSGQPARPEHYDVERLYQAVADREPVLEILQMIYDIHGVASGLRPPADEMRLASRRAGGGLKRA